MHPRKFVRDSLGTALSQYLARVALLARGAVAAAVLGPAGYGTWNALNLLLDYGVYAPLGALQGLDLRLPSAAARGDREESDRILGGAWWAVVFGGGLFVLACVAVLVAGPRDIVLRWGWGPPLLMLAAALIQLAIQVHASALRARGEFQAVSAALAAQAVLGGGLGLALVGPFGVWGLLGSWLAGSLVALALMRRGVSPPRLALGSPRAGLSLARLGFPVFGLFAISLLLRSVDRIAFVRYVGTEALGHYSLGLMAAGLILFLPEAAATVIYPRLSAAAQGARDAVRTRAELLQSHRALAVALPPLVAVGMVWAGPVIAWALPAFRPGIAPLRVLALGALTLSGATLPGYFVLSHGPRGRLLAATAAVTALTAALVFRTAAQGHADASVATWVAAAAAAGYAGFGFVLVGLSLPGLCASPGDRARLLATSFVPAWWAGGLAIAACAVGPESPGTAILRSAAVVVGYVPVLWWLGRGAGLLRLAQEWLAGRVTPAPGETP